MSKKPETNEVASLIHELAVAFKSLVDKAEKTQTEDKPEPFTTTDLENQENRKDGSYQVSYSFKAT